MNTEAFRRRYEQRVAVYGKPEPESPLGDTGSLLALVEDIQSLTELYGKGMTTAPLTLLAIQNLLRRRT